MKLKVGLFDGAITLWQQAILIAWVVALVSVVGLWAPNGVSLLTTGVLTSALLSVGQLLGLLATFFALTQFLLMGRIAWIESAFGLDRLASYHRFNGYAAIILIVLHPLFIVSSRVVASGQTYLAEYASTLSQPYVKLALAAEILFVLVVVSSIYIARKHMKFETWFYIHLMVYMAIVLAALHQFVNGGSLVSSPVALYYWLGLYIFVGLNLLLWRFGLLVFNFFRFDFRVVKVAQETPTTTSVYIHAKKVSRLKVKPGQFVLVRILAPKFLLQEHPFSLSSIPHNDQLRLTIRNVGDYTKDIQTLKPGARVMVSGPFGRFTRDVAITNKRLFIGGGVGITPLRSLIEEAVAEKTDSVLLYGNRVPDDTVLKGEIDTLAKSDSLKVSYIYSDVDKDFKGLSGRIDGEKIAQLASDFKKRDIYLCGPPPMMAAIVADLKRLGVPSEQVHYERFALHN